MLFAGVDADEARAPTREPERKPPEPEVRPPASRQTGRLRAVGRRLRRRF